MNISFIYLDFPFWRAEIGKIALFMGGIDFENRVITREEFERVKNEGCLDDGTVIPFHQFPCLVIDKQPIAQTGGIARFCGKLSGMYPKDDHILAAHIDQFIDFATDITVLVNNCGAGQGAEAKIALRKKLVAGDLARKLKILEKNLNEGEEWIIGAKIGLPDIAIWRLMGWLSSGTTEGIPTDLLKDFPKVLKICCAVDNHQKIREWVKLTYPEGYARGNFIL